eukprot:CAMPEP_0180543184 /NCGR_PEP_ID=MMETSP1036_2-20121128/68847_1 /TAXON_ID=632150 /ORGANISM="Azadinium spinosum, Strain 3D9" /LENGTH=39 /DNA_ID= /DNA_START= /DNA_END= /DNA_ORIENTATION=
MTSFGGQGLQPLHRAGSRVRRHFRQITRRRTFIARRTPR